MCPALPAVSRSAASRARRPDGYTLILGNLGTHVVNGAIYTLQYDLVKDFEPVALLPTNYQLLIARSGVPAKDFQGTHPLAAGECQPRSRSGPPAPAPPLI